MPTGHVTLEWEKMNMRSVGVIVEADGSMQYWAMLGDKKLKGTIEPVDRLPPMFLELIEEVYRPKETK